MVANFHVEADKLDLEFLNLLKKQFRNKSISITVEINDDTEYLNSSNEMISRIQESLNRRNVMNLDEVNEKLEI